MIRFRPFSVTVAALSVLSLSVLNLTRFGTAIARWELLKEFSPYPGPLYIALTGLIWFSIGLPVYWGLWVGHHLARKAALPAGIAYTIYYWLDRLFIQSRPQPSNWLFVLGFTFVLLIFVTIASFHPNTRNFFQREIHD